MPFLMIRQDITQMKVDAIVNAANSTLMGGGGVDGAIHRAAGPKLLAECLTLGGCKTGEAKITRGYRLPAKHVIHTVGPVYRGGMSGEPILLTACYRNSLLLAKEANCETVAFPLISAGVYGYPTQDAIRIAADTIRTFLDEHDDSMTVYLVIFDRNAMETGRELFPDIASYIDDRYVLAHTDAQETVSARKQTAKGFFLGRSKREKEDFSDRQPLPPSSAGTMHTQPLYRPTSKEEASIPHEPVFDAAPMLSLEERLAMEDESFSEMLLRKIDESGMSDAQCYKKANIDRKLFSKIRSDKYYKPSKQTVLAFAIALHLPIGAVRDLLARAGFALSHANKFDIIIEYFIESENYDIFAINEALFAFDQTLLGA